MNDSYDLEIENIRVINRALDYYSKSLKNLKENEIEDSMPLFNGQIDESLLEVESILEALKLNMNYGLNFTKNRLNFITLILEFYFAELSEDLEELEDTEENKKNMNLLEEEIGKITETIQLL
ncbi:hypothetical protein [Candidatus Nitrosarchaeum limnium]|jgi:hypothetical protein|uniref:Uncharacterized protein n=1 Tax=Candidatus Nitrosarchaeum limnium BG20 TaxID=859192 RepID=S2E557_9ARCH|nr:hypothetical protein [Candidatus Nitrosarchaeum limnium]EPA05883.1 hypothetical protein BG20_I2179 [Candidatus Nitrosarchaeum limnium BG20]